MSNRPNETATANVRVAYTIRPLNEREPSERQMTLLRVAAGDVLSGREEEYRVYRCKHSGRLVVKPVRFGREEAA